MQPSRRAAAVPPSVTFAIDTRVSELRAAGEDVVGLGAGQPDFPTPPEAIEAARAFVAKGRVLYTPSAGLPPLREAAAAHVSRVCGVTYEPSQLVVTNGAKEALSLAFTATCDPGDEVVLPCPSWVSYQPMVEVAGLVPVSAPTDADHGFKLTAESLDGVCTERTRAVMLNTPCNPTGSVHTRAELKAIAEVVVARDLVLISDEIYWCYVFDGEHVSPASLPGMAERTVVINGLSKSHAMTGWRIGFLAAPPAVAKVVGSLKDHLSSNISSPSQHAALGALASGDGHTKTMAAAFRRRRDLAVSALDAMPGVNLVPPQGAFYVFPRVDALYGGDVTGSVALCQQLLEQERLAAVPGAAFGEDRCIRLSISAADEQISEGLARMARCLARRAEHVG
jgi:aspartate aminotransferase